MRKATKLSMVFAALALLATACGDGDDEATPETPAETTEIAVGTTPETTAAGVAETTVTAETLPEVDTVSCSEPITVGVITDLTGPLSIHGAHMTRGVPIGFAYATDGEAQIGMEQLYTLGNCELRVIFRDDQSNPELGAAAAEDLIDAEGAKVIIGSVTPGVTATLQAIADEKNIVLIAAPTAVTEITGRDFNPNTFRTSRSNYQDGMAICDQFVNNDGLGTFVQVAPDYSFGYSGAQAYEDACTFFGGEFLQEAVFAPADTTDFTSYLTPLVDSGADAFLVTWEGGGFMRLLDSAIDLGVINDTTVLGAPFVDNLLMPAFFGDVVGTTSVISYHYSAPTNPANDYLIANQAAVGGTTPDQFDADGMNAAIMVIEALKATGGAADADALKATMEGLSFEGPKGRVEIRPEDHLAIQDMYAVTLIGFDNSAPLYEIVATVRPEPPCLLEAEFTSRCGDLPVGSPGG